jgi:hypothetical protein
MDANNQIIDTSNRLNKLDYESRRGVYQRSFSLGYLSSEEMNDRLVLISLVALVHQKMQLKDKNTTPLAVLLKITGEKEPNSAYYQFLETLSIIVEDFSYGIKKIDACGLKTSPEIINKIKEILNTWMPF